MIGLPGSAPTPHRPARRSGAGRRPAGDCPWGRFSPVALTGHGRQGRFSIQLPRGRLRAGGHLRRRHGHQPPAGRADRRRFRRPGSRGVQRAAGGHPARRRRPGPPVVLRGRVRCGRDRHLRRVRPGAGRVRPGRPGPRAQPGRGRDRPRAADDFATPDRPRWVAGSIGPGTKFPTLGQIQYADLRDAYEEQAAAPHRGRRRPDHHRDGLRPPPGQGGHQRGPAGHASGRPGACPSRPR